MVHCSTLMSGRRAGHRNCEAGDLGEPKSQNTSLAFMLREVILQLQFSHLMAVSILTQTYIRSRYFSLFSLPSHSLHSPSPMSFRNSSKSIIFRKVQVQWQKAAVRVRRGMLGNVCAELGSQFLHWTTLANMQMARHVVMQKCPASTLCTVSPVLAGHQVVTLH